VSVLSTTDLTKRYGGVLATDAVTLSLSEHKVHALIGPNGAGKTTLIAQLCGALAPDSGRIYLGNRDITRLSEPARVTAGLSRTFQISSLFSDFTVLENVAFSVQSKLGHSFKFWSDVGKNKPINSRAGQLLELLGLESRALEKATALSHGEQRQLEIAMALASEPQVLMLDEPMAGMSAEESMRCRTGQNQYGCDSSLSGACYMKLLEVDQLVAGYAQSQVLFDVSLHVEQGQVVSLLGRNGMGKTTTLSTIAGLLNVRSGSVRVCGTNVNGWDSFKIAKLGIGVVPEGRQIFPNLTTRENLIATAANRFNDTNPWTLERVLDLFPSLQDRLEFMGNLLSGGEQQMLAIGRALMTNPKLLILDDATEGLAPQVRAAIWRSLSTLKSSGLGILLVDKHVHDLLPLVDQHHIMEKGRIVWSGNRDDWESQPDVHTKYLSI